MLAPFRGKHANYATALHTPKPRDFPKQTPYAARNHAPEFLVPPRQFIRKRIR